MVVGCVGQVVWVNVADCAACTLECVCVYVYVSKHHVHASVSVCVCVLECIEVKKQHQEGHPPNHTLSAPHPSDF